MKIIAEGQTLCGNRPVNQDALFLNDVPGLASTAEYRDDSGMLCFAVADGVGGAAKGEIASQIVVQALSDWIRSFNNEYAELDEETFLDQFIRDGFHFFNQAVIRYSEEIQKTSATTLTLLVLLRGRFYLANIGDSPAFLLRRRKLIRLEETQTLGAMRSDSDRRSSGMDDHTLLSFLGNPFEDGADAVHISTGQYLEKDVFFLCTDGITEALNEREIRRCLLRRGQILPRLFQKLQKRTLSDNCTGIALRITR